ncbi:MAG TPA: hypothetical protein VJB90_04945 [Candidatus Nanoarchaeia archaeon]|nr:hypothetical protein [Candidatus Nanoarchaeia archaeon]
MKESDWRDCIECSTSLIITPDREKAKSLMKVSKGRVHFLESHPVTQSNANYVLKEFTPLRQN